MAQKKLSSSFKISFSKKVDDDEDTFNSINATFWEYNITIKSC